MSRARLYYRTSTGRPLRVAWALEEIGVDYESVAVSSDSSLEATSGYRHPLDRVPVLELDDGQVLFDSTAIVLTLADLHPRAGLTGPLGSTLRNQVYAWSLTAMTELERSALGAWTRTEHVEEQFYARQRRFFAKGAAAVGRQLGEQQFLLGPGLTAADIVLGGVLAVAQFVEVLDLAPPNVVAYLARLRSREAYVRALRRTESLLAV